MATNSCSIPVIDLQDFPAQSSKLVQVCQEWGCFRLVNHQNILSDSLMSEMKSVVKSLFDLPPDIKRRNSDVIAGSGYVAPSQTNPLYEAFGLYISSQQDVDAFCSQLDASPYQRETLIKYAKAVHELFVEISGKLVKGLGISNFTIEGWPFQFRINKYNFAQETVGSPGVQIHTDSGFLTILQDDEDVGGLEVMDLSGAFLPVDPWPNTLVVNLGDVATAWSNGRLRTVKHRVQCKKADLRYSIAAFLLGPKETIEAPAELVDAAHPRLYAPFTFEDYRKLRLSTKLQADWFCFLVYKSETRFWSVGHRAFFMLQFLGSLRLLASPLLDSCGINLLKLQIRRQRNRTARFIVSLECVIDITNY